MNSKNIFVTGGSGFVGKAVLEHLNDIDVQFVAPVRSVNTKFASSIKMPVIKGISHLTDALLASKDVDTVIHIAAKAHVADVSLLEFKKVNIDATLNLSRVAASCGVKRFVFVSSIGVNGHVTLEKPFSIFDEPKPLNSYTNSKYDAEIGLRKIAAETGLEVVIVRPTLVYGPNAPGNFGLLTKLVNKLPLLPFGLTNNKRDFIAVQNLADLLITCASHPNAAGHTFLASDMETVSIKQFTSAIAEGQGRKVFQLPIPVSLMRLAGKLMGKSAMVEQLVGNLQVDSSNLKEVLGWTPPYTMKQAMATLRDSSKSSSGKD